MPTVTGYNFAMIHGFTTNLPGVYKWGRPFIAVALMAVACPPSPAVGGGNGMSNDALVLPGGVGYVGDTAHDIVPLEIQPWESPADLASFLPGRGDLWFKAAPGLSSKPPALLFGSIVCPRPEVAANLPAGGLGAADLLSFPSAAWWGPASGAGAIQVRPPDPKDKTSGQTATWASDFDAGLAASVASPNASAAAAWNDLRTDTDERRNSLSFTGRTSTNLNGTWSTGGQALAMKGKDSQWEAADSYLAWNSGNFQEVRLSPFAQKASLGACEDSEAGLRLEHRLNMAGIVKTVCGAGFSERESAGNQRLKAGYFQGAAFGDALGRVALDGAFRLDGYEGRRGAGSAAAGVKVPTGDFVFSAAVESSAYAPWDMTSSFAMEQVNAQSIEVGYNPGAAGTFRIRVRHETLEGARVFAVAPTWLGRFKFPAGKFIKNAVWEVSLERSSDVNDGDTATTGAIGRLGFDFPAGLHFWVFGRAQNGEPTAVQSGAEWKRGHLALGVAADNVTDRAVPWPESLLAAGRRLRGTAQISW